MLGPFEFRERIEFILADATQLSKKQQAFMDFNKLLITHQNDSYLKLTLQTFEQLKKQYFTEIEIRAIKLIIQCYKKSIQLYISRILQLILKGFGDGQDVTQQLLQEIIIILYDKQSEQQLYDFILPIALKQGSQIIQVSALLCLQALLSQTKEIAPQIRKLIIQFYVKNQLVLHQCIPDMIVKLISNKDPQFLQVFQRSLANLQEQKHLYQIKVSICKLLEYISKLDYQFDEQSILQAITILRELTFDRVTQLQNSAKSALMSFQSIYIQKNPPVIQQRFVSEVKPFIKKKRGDNHLILDAGNFKKPQIGENMIKSKLLQYYSEQQQQKIKDQLLQEELERQQQQQQKAQEQNLEQLTLSQIKEKLEQDEQPSQNQIQKIISIQENQIISYQQQQSVDLDATQVFEDPLEQTQDFNSFHESKVDVYELIRTSKIDEAFDYVISQKDDILLLQLMSKIPNYLGHLKTRTAKLLIERFALIQQSNFINLLFKEFVDDALNGLNRDNLKIAQLNQLQILQNRLLFLYIANSKLIVPRKVTDAIDCGSHIDQRSSIGVKFKKDSNFSIDDSHPVDYYHDPQFGRPIIKFSEDTSLYMTQRQSDNPFYYYLSLGKQFPEKQKYTLILKFAELYWKESGKRIFNVKIGSKQVIKELDVYNISGFSAAHDEYIEIEIDEGYVIHEDQTIKGALNMNNSLIIGFVPVVDRAMISAIYLFKGPLNETDYYDKENLRRKWDTHDLTFDERRERRQKKQEAVNQKIKEKQEIIKIRSGFEHEIQVEEIQQNMKINKEPERPQLIWPEFSLELLFIMIQTPLGIIMLIGFLTVSFVTFYFTFFDPYGMKAYQRRVRELELRTLPEKYIPVAQRAQKID